MNRTFTQEEQRLLLHTLQALDTKYDPAAHLLLDSNGAHTVRTSCYYALGLLARNLPGDVDAANEIIGAIIDLQLDAPQEIYHGTFKRTDRDPDPVRGNYPWRSFSPHARFTVDKWEEQIMNTLRLQLPQEGFSPDQTQAVEKCLQQSIVKHIPLVWKTYDPNWRDFMGTVMAVAVALYAERLTPQTLARMESAMEKAVTGAISRHDANLTPMNTNVQLMHIFVADYFGTHLHREDFSAHAREAAENLLAAYMQYHSIAEFNSPTYCSVDLTALAFMRSFGATPRIREIGTTLEAGIWEDIYSFYNPHLRNISGPYSRNYDMEMASHTSMYALLYIGLGEACFPFPSDNAELGGNVLIALGGVHIPAHLQEKMLHFEGNRRVERQFHELIERGEPGANQPLCTASAFISRDLMLGAMRGSHNTSHQLQSATAFWEAPNGSVSTMCLLRRAPGEAPAHYRTVFFNNTADENTLDIDVRFEVERDMELYFEFCGTLEGARITDTQWELPGLRATITADAPPVRVEHTASTLCACYLYRCTEKGPHSMHFHIVFEHVSSL